jgi:hypothetical protein
MANETETYAGLLHAGGGTGLFLVQLSVVIPGLLPTVGLLGVFIVLVLLPVLVLGLAVTIVAAPPYAVWRLATRARRRSQRLA